ncbi:hypothetical protein JHK82_020099 [Glycine max]|nr:hypothetical protein JHK85_020548 [Glycine max]KAG5135368.1 hypothetical protein JHK82_020099 [Glycine max]
MAQDSEKICEGASESAITPVIGTQAPESEPKSTPTTQRIKATRHPRWTRQETLVLIESKKMVESGEQVCRFRSASGYVQTDPKWDMVSSLCQQRGVKRGAVQCRKRWGNLLTDFRKIKKWESSVREESESFWIMRNDVRKEKKLPGFFDSVVYNVLDGGVCTTVAFPLTLVKMAPNKVEILDGEKMGWSTEEENMETNITGNMINGFPKTPKKGIQREPIFQEGMGYKRKRLSSDISEDSTDFNNITKLLRRNSDILKAHIGTQNINYQLARDQQKQQTDIIVAALGKLTDALTKIADKL